MCKDEDAARYVVKLIMQDQPPADNQELIANSLQDLQRMAQMVTARVNHRIAAEQCKVPQLLLLLLLVLLNPFNEVVCTSLLTRTPLD